MNMMSKSFGKHELDIPMLDPEHYLEKFRQSRDAVYQQLGTGIKRNVFLESAKQFLDSVEESIDVFILKQFLYRKSLEEDEAGKLILNKLQQKFAIFGRWFSKYDQKFRKMGNDSDDQELYLLGALIFYQSYDKDKDYNSLNTALKLADKSLEYGVSDQILFRYTFQVEEKILQGLYELY